METCKVYRVNKQGAAKIAVGTLMERRRTERGDNIVGMLKLAATRFLVSTNQTIQINFRGILYEMEIHPVKGFRPK